MKDYSILMPKYRFENLTDVTPEDLRKMGAKGIGLDIDNVIAPDGTYKYAEGVREWVRYSESGRYRGISAASPSCICRESPARATS